MKSRLLLVCLVSLMSLSWAHAQVTVSVGNISVSRSTTKSDGNTGQPLFWEEMDVQLKLHGDAVATAKSERVTVTSAVDDTGADLTKPQFDGMAALFSGNSPDLITGVNLKNPAAAAKSIKVLKGEVELYEPQADPNSTATVENFLKSSGVPVVSSVLAAAGVQVVVTGTSQTGNGSGTTAASTVKIPGGVISNYVSVTSSTSYRPATTGTGASSPAGSPAKKRNRWRRKHGPNGPQFTITLKITDPKEKIVGIEFQDASGIKIRDLGYSGVDMFGTETKTYNFPPPFPDNARLVIYLADPAAYLKVPFSFTDIPIPTGGK